MATTVRSTSTNTSSGTAISVSAPTGTANGDLVLVYLAGNGAITFADNNGATPFTEDVADFQYVSDGTISLFSRRIQSGDPTTYNFTRSTSDRWTAIAVSFQNPHSSVIYDVAASTNSAGPVTTGTAVDITTLNANSIHIAVLSNDGPNNAITSTPAGYNVEQNSGQQRSALTSKTIVSPSATGAQSFSWTTLSAYGSLSFSIRDEGAAAATNLMGAVCM